MVQLPDAVERLSRPSKLWLSLVVVLVLGVVDYATGYEAFFAVFYLVPIAFAAWHVSQRWGLIFSFLSAVVWAYANWEAAAHLHSAWIYPWNTLTRFAMFLLVTRLLGALREALEHERDLARTDPLTGIANRRAFIDVAERELLRCRRHGSPVTVLYADLDSFKTVNDRLGHAAGDALLREVAATAMREVRALDVVARLGGDEFAVLLPETGLAAARQATQRLQHALADAMAGRDCPVTCSIGAMTYLDPPASTAEMLQHADALMYAVKQAGRNAVRHDVFGARAGAAPGGPVLP